MSKFTQQIINDYQTEMSETYGVFVSDADAQTQLSTLVRSMFPIVIAEQKTESRERGQGLALASLEPARFLSDLKADEKE